jgi:photosystem II stability/assembly factor-like uncharacterized protein
MMTSRQLLLVGTKKGTFVLEGDTTRDRWTVRGPLCEGWPIHDVSWDASSGAILAGGGSPWYGPAVWRSDDLGETWTHSSDGLTYADDGPKLSKVWNVTAAHGSVWAGVDPAGLFKSADGGTTWQHVEGLRSHPSTPDWQPGNGGLCLHTIVPHPTDADRMWVGISAVGAFETVDGGATWELRNKGVRADFDPATYPEFGQCVHKMAMAAGRPDTLYQQNHCGVYRTDDGGRQWTEITAGLPSQFGFPMVAHPRDPSTVWTVPLNGDDRGRYAPDAALGVWRTSDAGESWGRYGDGLPQRDAYLSVLRESMAVDRLDPVGVYIGTSAGQLFASRDEGETWRAVAEHLPPIWSVDAVTLD